MTTFVAWTFQIASEPCPCWKTKTMIPKAAPSEARLRTTALRGRNTDLNALIRRTNVSSTTNPRTSGNLP
jgi:hypothetical protein